MSPDPTVLLVDGDLAAMTPLIEGLSGNGCRVLTAEDGGEALFQLAGNPVELVILALDLPTFSGKEVLKRIRDDERLENLPVIVLMANARQKPFEVAGPVRFLNRKETAVETLIETVHEFLSETNPNPRTETVTRQAGSPVIPDMNTQNAVQEPAVGSTNPDGAKARSKFLKKIVADLPKIREDCSAYLKSPKAAAGQKHLSALTQRIQSLVTEAQEAESTCIAMLAAPFDALLTSVTMKATEATPSVLQTVAQAVDCLGLLVDERCEEFLGTGLKPQALVVDDDPISNEVNVTSLQQANFDTTSIEDPVVALDILAGTPFDLVLLDVNMPRMTGFQLCEKLRQLPQGRTTPVIFLTAFNNFENRTKSVLSGGGDFITKPVSTRELALKATIHLLKAQVRAARDEEPSALNDGMPRPFQASPAVTESGTSDSGRAEFLTIAPGAAAPSTGDTETRSRKGKAAKAEAGGVQEKQPPALKIAEAPPAPEPAAGVSTQSSAETAAMFAELEKERASLVQRLQVAEKELAEARAQVEAGKAEAQKAQASTDAKLARSGNLEKELEETRRSRDELQKRLAEGEEAAGKALKEVEALKEQLNQRTAEMERIRGERAKETAARTLSESELRTQLTQAQAASAQAETALKEKEESHRLLEEELVPLRKVRDQLQQKQQQAAAELNRIQAELAKETANRSRIESELRSQVESAKAAAAQAAAALKEKDENYHLLEEELAPLRKAREQFQQRQQQNQAEIERLKSELKTQSAERAKSEAALNEELKASRAATTQMESVLKETATRCRTVEKELETVRSAKEKLQKEHDAAVAERERLKVELAKESAQRQKSESELRGQLEAAKENGSKLEAALKAVNAKASELEAELKSTRQARDQAQKQLEQTGADLAKTRTELQRESTEHARVRAESQKLATEKKTLETELARLRESLAAAENRLQQSEQKLQQNTATLVHVSGELDKEKKQHQAARQRADGLAARLKGLHGELSKYLAEEPPALPKS